MRRYEQTDSDFVRKDIEEFMDDRPCATCKGLRLKQEAMTVTIRGLNIMDIGEMSIQDAYDWTKALQEDRAPAEAADSSLYRFFKIPQIVPAEDDLSENERTIAKQVFKEILARLTFLVSVGLNYLSINRTARTLSGGEYQRIRLAFIEGARKKRPADFEKRLRHFVKMTARGKKYGWVKEMVGTSNK